MLAGPGSVLAASLTGGILIGHYTPLHGQAVITEVSGPPKDSVLGRWSFTRGLLGLQRRVDRAWRRHDFYLGEWHFHPFASPTPSPRDREQVVAFSKDPEYRCPQPLLVVVGGDPLAGVELWVGVVGVGALRGLLPWGATATTSASIDGVGPSF